MTDLPIIGPDIKWCQFNNAELRKLDTIVPGEAEVDAVLGRAIVELLSEHGVDDIAKTTSQQRLDFCHAINGASLQEKQLQQLNRYVRKFGVHQVIALLIDSIFMLDVKVVVTEAYHPIKAAWRHSA